MQENKNNQPRPVSYWEDKFKTVGKQELTNYNNWSTWDDSFWYYFLAYGIDGYTAMYEATNNTKYLDQALQYINKVVSDAKISSSFPLSQYKDDYLGWICRLTNITNPTPDEIACLGNEIPLYESYMWRYVTKVLRLIRQTPALYNNSNYKKQYNAILSFTEPNIFKKWYNRGQGNIYRTRTHMASHWAYIALDLWLISADESMKPLYKEVFDNIDKGDCFPVDNQYYNLRSQIIPNPADESAYFWNSEWGKYIRPGQDTSHGNNVISYMVESHDHNPAKYWDDNDITGLIHLLMDVLWNKTAGSGADFADFFDGTNDPNPQNHTGNFQSDGFIKLGRFDKAVQIMYETYVKQVSYQIPFYGNGALNAKILTDPAARGSWL